MPSITARAEAAIGRDSPETDWQLRPEEHARNLPTEAGALKRILGRPEVYQIMTQFRQADAAAEAAQARYKRIGRLGLYAATIASFVGALFLLPLEAWRAGWPSHAASAVQILALVSAFVAARLLAYARPFDAWMKQRAAAEIARIDLFGHIAQAEDASTPDELPALPLKLEYFRRYQLDVQRRYYRGRGERHATALWRNNLWLSTSLAITAVAVLLAALASLRFAAGIGVPIPTAVAEWSSSISGPGLQRVLLALGVIASSLYGLGVARSLMDLDERNASRYLVTADNLDFLAEGGLPSAREAAAESRLEPVLAFIAEVQGLISSEHREWLLLREIRADPAKLRYASAT